MLNMFGCRRNNYDEWERQQNRKKSSIRGRLSKRSQPAMDNYNEVEMILFSQPVWVSLETDDGECDGDWYHRIKMNPRDWVITHKTTEKTIIQNAKEINFPRVEHDCFEVCESGFYSVSACGKQIIPCCDVETRRSIRHGAEVSFGRNRITFTLMERDM